MVSANRVLACTSPFFCLLSPGQTETPKDNLKTQAASQLQQYRRDGVRGGEYVREREMGRKRDTQRERERERETKRSHCVLTCLALLRRNGAEKHSGDPMERKVPGVRKYPIYVLRTLEDGVCRSSTLIALLKVPLP